MACCLFVMVALLAALGASHAACTASTATLALVGGSAARGPHGTCFARLAVTVSAGCTLTVQPDAQAMAWRPNPLEPCRGSRPATGGASRGCACSKAAPTACLSQRMITSPELLLAHAPWVPCSPVQPMLSMVARQTPLMLPAWLRACVPPWRAPSFPAPRQALLSLCPPASAVLL